MPGFDVNQMLIPSRALPAPQPDARVPVPNARGGRYGEQYVQSLVPDMGMLADEGSYYCCSNAQTGIATAAAPTSFSATNPFLLIYNGESPANVNAKRVYLDYAVLVATAAGTNGTDLQFAVTLDAGNRYASGGSNLTTLITNPNGDVRQTSVATVYAGNITASAATTSARTIVGRRYMKGAIPVAGDTYGIKFGGVDAPAFFGVSTILFSLNNVPKVIVPPNWTAMVHIWLTAQSAASSYAPEAGWFER